MDENARQEENQEGPKNIENKKTEGNNEINSVSHSTLKKNQKERSHSRSRSPSTKSSKQWMSSNAFLNFVQEFRENFTGTKSSKILQLAGERWRSMSPKEKRPYILAAKNVRNQKQEQQKNEQGTKSTKNTEQKSNENVKKRQIRNNKQPRKKSKERKQNNKKRKKAVSDSDSAASSTAGSVSSEDISDSS